MENGLDWNKVATQLSRALGQRTAARAATSVGNAWRGQAFTIDNRPEFVVHLYEAILEQYRQSPTQAEILKKKAKECLHTLGVVSEIERTVNGKLPPSLQFVFERIEASLFPDNLDAIFPWLRRCYDLANDESAHYFRLFKWNREESMRELVFEDCNGPARIIRRTFDNPNGQLHLPHIADWYRRRYDLGRALRLYWNLRPPIFPIFAKCPERWIWGVPLVFLALFFVILTGLLLPSNADPTFALWAGAGTVAVALLVTGVAFRDLLLPRLFAGTAIGYLFLLIEKDIWEFLVIKTTSATWQMWGLAGLALSLSLFYLYQADVQKMVISKREGLKRTFHVIIIGLAQSAVMGFVLSFFIALPLAQWQGDLWLNQLQRAGDVFGIFPMALVIQVPIALFVGIMTQTLWEDKLITESL